MAINHELSSDIAAALLTRRQRDTAELKELKETILLVYSTLQRLTSQQSQHGTSRKPNLEDDKRMIG